MRPSTEKLSSSSLSFPSSSFSFPSSSSSSSSYSSSPSFLPPFVVLKESNEMRLLQKTRAKRM
ncbi:hypothetical protein E2C01_050571 [Portunus trituberculatus]|uniref:Uncharacterized protein n=1 Tax=Portunus trituberculatus TaxID=210409 RepID=A0A5B7GHD6_PORTR|nr:hypothetical protein [Portunus trituberculatus]